MDVERRKRRDPLAEPDACQGCGEGPRLAVLLITFFLYLAGTTARRVCIQ